MFSRLSSRGLIAYLMGFTLIFSAQAQMTIEHNNKEVNLHIIDGDNRLYVEIEIPFHEMGDASKRLAAARAIHFLKQDLSDMWRDGKMPKDLDDLMNTAMSLGELQYEKIYDRIKDASGAKVRRAIEEALPDVAKNQMDKLSGVDWWRPAGILVEVGAKGKFQFSFLKGLSGTFAEVVVPQCVHRIRKIPIQDSEKDGQLIELLKDPSAGLMDRAYNIVLTKLYGTPCTENLDVLISKLQAKEGKDYYNHFYFAEESYVKSNRKFLFWADSRIGPRKMSAEDAAVGVQGKFTMGVIYGHLRRPEHFSGATTSVSKTFQLPESAKQRTREWILRTFPQLAALTRVNWGWHAKAGALIWNERFYPYFLMGPEVGTQINSKAEFNPGTVLDIVDFVKSLASNFADSLSAGYSTDGPSREDVFSLKEFAEERRHAIQEATLAEEEK